VGRLLGHLLLLRPGLEQGLHETVDGLGGQLPPRHAPLDLADGVVDLADRALAHHPVEGVSEGAGVFTMAIAGPAS